MAFAPASRSRKGSTDVALLLRLKTLHGSICCLSSFYTCVAFNQLISNNFIADYESEGRRFESFRARHYCLTGFFGSVPDIKPYFQAHRLRRSPPLQAGFLFPMFPNASGLSGCHISKRGAGVADEGDVGEAWPGEDMGEVLEPKRSVLADGKSGSPDRAGTVRPLRPPRHAGTCRRLDLAGPGFARMRFRATGSRDAGKRRSLRPAVRRPLVASGLRCRPDRCPALEESCRYLPRAAAPA